MLSNVETSLTDLPIAFEAVMLHQQRMLGYFIVFELAGDALFEIDDSAAKRGAKSKRSPSGGFWTKK